MSGYAFNFVRETLREVPKTVVPQKSVLMDDGLPRSFAEGPLFGAVVTFCTCIFMTPFYIYYESGTVDFARMFVNTVFRSMSAIMSLVGPATGTAMEGTFSAYELNQRLARYF